ncbi:hypothetical protein JMA08_06460 [Acinetobacter baumannii]|uniref:hypothetical protein n=1 Tax=Acinetobacter baumannii TaxID=470 RepID=UPI0010FE987C|nr:hypothetical protein [Acinetobacter baumannii]MBU0431698.1 hypothetical protein [Acinetobacter baumannii]MBU0434017.1 hypothetical protein [Acinetobacter baumannii]MBV6559153.1 hypothetical protein [Acinetobacter baumannii]MBV6580325.1 hypothetical protein [Acinetobacter baumannii]MBV6585290.1 hypothetical protein [Acinetobacter baumannii]
MPQYLMIAEKVYKKIKEDDLFSDTPTEHLNNLIGVIRKEIKGTKFKLKYNFIDFDECLTKPLDECAVKIDISLMPSHKNKDEYILWLAGFIEKITEGGPKPPPPIKKFIPEYMSLKYELDFLPLNEEKIQTEGKEITDYFNSKLYKATFKK